MATMSVGATIVFFALVLTSLSPAELKTELKTELARKTSGTYFRLSLFLALACLVSLVGGALFPLSYGNKHSVVHFASDMAKAWYLFWPLILVIGLRRITESDRFFVIQAWMWAFGLLSFVGIIQYFTGWPRPQPIPGEISRYHATLFLGHHLSVASVFIFPFFVCLDLFRHAWHRASLPKRVNPTYLKYVFGVISGLGCITLFLTYSRTLWIALPIGILIGLLWGLPRKMWPAFGLLCILALGTLSLLPSVQRRIHVDMGIGPRVELWKANFEFFKRRPVTGVGWRHNQELSGYYLIEKNHSSDVFSGHAHNNLIDMLGGTGLLGTLAWLVWCSYIFIILFQKKDQNHLLNFKHALICAWIVFHLNGLTQVNFWEAKVQHQMAWVIAWSLL